MDKALQTMIDNMLEKTGKSLEEWIQILNNKSFEKHSQAVTFLKEEYNVTHGFANTIVTLSKTDGTSESELLSNQYKGKETLKPIYDKIVNEIKAFGDDIKIVPKKTEVSIERKRKFAVIKAATNSRIDLGLKLKNKPITSRLESSGPFGTMCTHRVRLSSIKDVNTELIEWLKEAYTVSG